jgi:ferric-dicitrate binding protein FerR (iron transport regulator)
MSRQDRKEDEVRRMLEARHPAVPADLAARATEHGTRLLRRRRAVRRAAWLLLMAAAIAFAIWAAMAEPWGTPPTQTTPPLEGW